MEEEDNDATPVPHDREENRAVNVWTPEDASRFLTSAIQEAQRPLTDALRQRSVSPGIFALVVAILIAFAALGGWVLLGRLDKADRAAENARAEREMALDKRHEIQARQEALIARLTAVQEYGERTRRELEAENEILRTQVVGFKTGEEELKRLRTDLNRHRRQADLLRNQISGLEMEKQALARQLSAVKALAAGDEEDREDHGDSFPPDPVDEENVPLIAPAPALPIQDVPIAPVIEYPVQDVPVSPVPAPPAQDVPFIPVPAYPVQDAPIAPVLDIPIEDGPIEIPPWRETADPEPPREENTPDDGEQTP